MVNNLERVRVCECAAVYVYVFELANAQVWGILNAKCKNDGFI